MFDDRPQRLSASKSPARSEAFANAKDAAAFFGWNYNTYSQHERGERGITRAVDQYAKDLRVSKACC